MKLSILLESLTFIAPLDPGNLTAVSHQDVSGVTSDSRKVRAGMVFVALRGTQSDGHRFLAQAAEQGALALVVDSRWKPKAPLPAGVAVLVADNTYKALGALSSRFYGDPGKKLRLVGVTGTNGKTTVTHLLERMIADWGKPVGLLGTLGKRSPASGAERQKYEATGHTTPMATELHAILADMLRDKTEVVVLEVSSHALEQDRVYGCDFEVAIHTNVTQDHLDYHLTMEKYGETKARLFSGLSSAQRAPAAVINLDDAWAERFLQVCPAGTRIYTYGLRSPEALIRAENIDYGISGAAFTVITPEGETPVKLKIAGRFGVCNALAAIAGGLALGIPLERCVKSLAGVHGVRGRFEVVSESPYVIVDYAHTPDGLENVLEAARQVTPTDARLITVFGCGGDRDATKRPRMGAIAERLADVVVVTSDNPRTEDPQQIITDILNGIKTFDPTRMIVDADRRQAIHQALDLAGPDDIIVVAGKGHEDYQILADRTIPFDDREVVQAHVSSRQNWPTASSIFL